MILNTFRAAPAGALRVWKKRVNGCGRREQSEKIGILKPSNFHAEKVIFRGNKTTFGFYGSKTTGQILEVEKLKQITANFVRLQIYLDTDLINETKLAKQRRQTIAFGKRRGDRISYNPLLKIAVKEKI